MPIHADNFEMLHSYAEGVMGRVACHAGNVGSVALALLGSIIWRGEPGSVEIKQYDGKLANVLWVEINGAKYAFSYNHEKQEIEMRDRTTHGEVLHSFSNQTPLTEIEDVFRRL